LENKNDDEMSLQTCGNWTCGGSTAWLQLHESLESKQNSSQFVYKGVEREI
jgi:hypothetical protein